MNRILNWTIGSFFRTIGRIIAYLGIGILIAYILNSSNFNWGGITELFFDRVNALSLDGELIQESAIFSTGVKQVQDSANDGNTHTQIINFDYNYANSTHNYMIFPITGFQWQYSEIWMPATSEYIQQLNLNSYLSIKLIPTNGSWVSCEIQNNLIVCPMFNLTTYSGLEFKFKATTQLTGYAFDLNKFVWIYDKDEKSIQNAIDSQTQQQQQNHEETQNYLEDTNTTQANTEGQDFINNFSNDTHGLTGIITAPLNAIQSLVGSTCSNLVLPLPFVNNKSLTLPCMSTIYSEHFGVFYTMYQGIILALISYWVCVRLFTLVKGFKDPEDDKIEVMDL